MYAYVAVKDHELHKVVFIDGLDYNIEEIEERDNDIDVVTLLDLNEEQVANLKKGMNDLEQYDFCVLEDHHLVIRQTRGRPIFWLATEVCY